MFRFLLATDEIENSFLGNPSSEITENGDMVVDTIEVYLKVFYFEGPSKQAASSLPIVSPDVCLLVGWQKGRLMRFNKWHG